MTNELTHVDHPLEPIFDKRSRVLVLGTMPSPVSRAAGFYYAHPRNRFWQVLAALFDEPVAATNERRRDQLLRHHIALWDVLASCDIEGASDASITNAHPNDLKRIIDAAPIEAVFCTGAKSAELYARHCRDRTGIDAVKLPSTSPANAAATLDDLVGAYRAILPHLHEYELPTFDVPDVVSMEQTIDRSGTSLAELMDRAGGFLAHRVHEIAPDATVAILCGNGNNGGDGWVAARDLAARGHAVTLICARAPEQLKAQPARDTAIAALPVLQQAGVRILHDPDNATLRVAFAECAVIVDAILGTGFSGATVKEPFARWIDAANARRKSGTRIIAADVPSGFGAQAGTASHPAIVADETITMIVSKTGLAAPDAARYCGNIRIAPIAYIEPFL